MQRIRILVVDDDPDILLILRDNLEMDGYEVFEAHLGKECLEIASQKTIDLVILDLMLPDMDGIHVCRAIRRKSSVPIIMLTAKDQVSDKVLGLDSGADDYVVKPFDYLELAARVKACLRRNRPKEGGEILEAGPLRINRNTRSAEINGKKVNLTAKEFEILYLLVRNRGKVVERQEIKNSLWPEGKLYQWSRAIDVHIQHLRAKLGDDPRDPQIIFTIPGAGYMVKGNVQGD